MRPPAVGVFVGGRGLRMGGVAKGLLMREGRTLLDRLVEACRLAAAPHQLLDLYLVGNAAAYADTPLPHLADDPAGVGPMGGLRSLLRAADGAGLDAVALAVDLAYPNVELMRRLFSEQPAALALAPREAERWQPLFARYRPAAALPVVEAALAAGKSSLQEIFAGLARGPGSVVELVLSPLERGALRDWDRPSDMAGTEPDAEP
jgi:molybdopterin-guanine dinucleotide biosynthesis protein A